MKTATLKDLIQMGSPIRVKDIKHMLRPVSLLVVFNPEGILTELIIPIFSSDAAINENRSRPADSLLQLTHFSTLSLYYVTARLSSDTVYMKADKVPKHLKPDAVCLQVTATSPEQLDKLYFELQRSPERRKLAWDTHQAAINPANTKQVAMEFA